MYTDSSKYLKFQVEKDLLLFKHMTHSFALGYCKIHEIYSFAKFIKISVQKQVMELNILKRDPKLINVNFEHFLKCAP